MNVLYVCRANIGRSQMAQGFHNKFAKGKATSAGTHGIEHEGKKLGELTRGALACQVMQEEGINIKDQKIKQLNKKSTDTIDKIITMVPKKQLPPYLAQDKRVMYWKIADAKGKDYEFHIKTRDKIKQKVLTLLNN